MVYFIGSKEHDICKIGMTNRPKKRLRVIQTGSHVKLEIIRLVDEWSYAEEKILHDTFKEYKVLGEWYCLSMIDVNIGIECVVKKAVKKAKLDKDKPVKPSVFNISEDHLKRLDRFGEKEGMNDRTNALRTLINKHCPKIKNK